MVNINDVYLVMSTIAVTHEVPEPKNVNVKDFEQFLGPAITVGGSVAGTVISSQREQIEIIIANNVTNVRDLSGRKDFSASKVGMILEFFVGNYGLKINSYGVNFILRVPCLEAQKWIRENILSSRISEKTGKELVGGVGTMSVKSGRKTWNIKFESTEDKKIAVDFNASQKINKLPNADVLRDELKKQWNSLVKFLSDLGL